MNDKALVTLEYNKILERLGEYIASDIGREYAAALRPAHTFSDAETLLSLTDEAYGVYRRQGRTPISAFPDIRGVLRRAHAAYALSAGDLLSIQRCLSVSRVAREQILEAEGCDKLAPMTEKLSSHRSVEEEIARCILSEEEIADNASPELARVRRQMRVVNERVREKLNNMIKSPATQKFLQEPIITMRNGRYALPVRAEYRAQVNGLVHDQSGSGATLFIEPAAVVELGNEFKRLQSEEQAEIERILATLTAMVEPYTDELYTSLTVLGTLDVIFAKAVLAREQRAQRPKLGQDGYLEIRKGRHPLLNPDTVVPIDIWLGGAFRTLIVTGPNTGGKTVTLKTVGLFTLMAMSGLFVPAEYGTALSVFDEVFADIGDEQSIEQSLSTFSSHMNNIVGILQRANERSLVLLDELGAGTDPVEGAALAQAILESLYEAGARTLATTHYSEIKAFALMHPGMQNASMEFDVDKLSPTYRLFVGIPGKSNAFEIAKRLGLSESVIARAAEFLEKKDVAFEDVLSGAEQARREAERGRDEAREAAYEAERIRTALKKEQEKLENEKTALRQKARDDARRMVLETRAEMERLIRELRSVKDIDPKTLERAIQGARDAARSSEEQLSERLTGADGGDDGAPGTVLPGQRVRIVSLDQEGSVLKSPNERGEVAVQVGVIKMTVNLSDLRLVEQRKEKPVSSGKAVLSADRGARLELDLRGRLVDEAVMEIDHHIDDSELTGIKEFAIIHGKGTGALRAGVQNYLRSNPRVKSFRIGAYGEGDAGVTVVTLK